MKEKKARTHQSFNPPRVPLLIMLTRPVYRIVRILADDEHTSVSRIGARLIHDALGLGWTDERPTHRSKRRNRGRR